MTEQHSPSRSAHGSRNRAPKGPAEQLLRAGRKDEAAGRSHDETGEGVGRGTRDADKDSRVAEIFCLPLHVSPSSPGQEVVNTGGEEGGGTGNAQGSGVGARNEDNQGRFHGEGGGEDDTGGEERDDADDDPSGRRDGAGADDTAARCSCVVCNIQLGTFGFVLIPGRGYAHRACAEEFYPDYNIPPRARQQPSRLVPAFGGTSHLQRDAEATRPIVPMTHQSQQALLQASNNRTTATGGRRRGGVGQGRGPDEPDQRTFSEMQGLWVALSDGRRCLVVAAGTVHVSGRQALLVVPRDGGGRLAIPWLNGQPEAEVILGEPRELAEGRLPVLRPREQPRGVWLNGLHVDAVVTVGRASYSIHREVLLNSSTINVQRAQQVAARALSVVEALSVIARRPVPGAVIARRPEPVIAPDRG